MKNNLKFTEFIDDMLSFEPDFRIVFIPENENREKINIAAAADKHVTMDKIGLIKNSDCKVVGKVFEDHESDKYIIHFLPSPDADLSFAVLSDPDSPKYFLIDENRKVEIPGTDSGHLTDEYFHITLAKDIFRIKLDKIKQTKIGVVKGSKNGSLHFKYDETCAEIIFTLEGGNDQKPKKLMFISKDLKNKKRVIRLLPVRKYHSSLLLPQDCESSAIVCIY